MILLNVIFEARFLSLLDEIFSFFEFLSLNLFGFPNQDLVSPPFEFCLCVFSL